MSEPLSFPDDITDVRMTYGLDLATGPDTTAIVASIDGFRSVLVRFSAAIDTAAESFGAFARMLDGIRWRARIADYQLHGRTRPDGRPRRSGHRHRGTAAWARRHG